MLVTVILSCDQSGYIVALSSDRQTTAYATVAAEIIDGLSET